MRKSADYIARSATLKDKTQAKKHTSKLLGRFTLLDVGHFNIKRREGMGKEEGRWR
jgi:hypothetical protein